MERSNTGISQVLQVEETGQDSQVSLVDDHVPMAKDELLDSEVISAVSLSTYLYRNFTFEAGDEKEEPPTATDLVDVFKDEFGYEDAEDEFDQLFTTENVDNLFEEYND